jgi:fermentation-respiration switch protein FrsA (DUF1100 family)
MKTFNRGIASVAILNVMSAMAQNMSFGADNFYLSQNVSVQPITFQNHYQMTLAANLFTPNNVDRSASLSAIIVGHPMGASKEQAANLYATKLAEQGFVTVSVDLPYWGSSDGEPRNAVVPDLFTETFSAAVDYLGAHDLVNRERIGVLGVCGSASFVISAAKIDHRIKAVATSSMYDMGAFARDGIDKTQTLEQRMEYIDTASQQRWDLLANRTIPYAIGTPLSVRPNSSAIELEYYDFYRTTRGQFAAPGTPPNTTTLRTLMDESKFMNFYPFNDIETISPRPMLFVSGDQAHSRAFSAEAYKRAAEPKELLWIPGAGHVDLYDRVELIPFAKFTEFFMSNL